MGCSNSAVQEVPHKFHDSYKLGDKIGAGSFAQVRVCISASSSTAVPNKEAAAQLHEPKSPGQELDEDVNLETFAVKIIDLRSRDSYGYANSKKSLDQGMHKSVQREKGVWTHAAVHEHVVRLFETYFERGLFYFVMEMCQTSVLDALHDDPYISEVEVMRVFHGMLRGIAYLHDVGIVHRDVKLDNFMLGGKIARVVKICDFGLSEFITKLPRPNRTCHGTAPYISPEMLLQEGYDDKTDVWSFGVTAYLLLYGDFPYAPDMRAAWAMKDATRRGSPAPMFRMHEDFERLEPSEFSESFCRALLNRNQKERPSAKEALELPLMQQVVLVAELHDIAAKACDGEPARTTSEKQAMIWAHQESAAQEAEPAAQVPVMSRRPSLTGLGLGGGKDMELTITEAKVEQGVLMKQMFLRARQKTKEFKVTIDPTVIKGMDELLMELQKVHQCQKGFSRSFSLTLPSTKTPEETCSSPQPGMDRRMSKSSTLGDLEKLMGEDSQDIERDDVVSICDEMSNDGCLPPTSPKDAYRTGSWERTAGVAKEKTAGEVHAPRSSCTKTKKCVI